MSGDETICSYNLLFTMKASLRRSTSQDSTREKQDVSEPYECEAWTRKNSQDPTSEVGGRIPLTRAGDVKSEYQLNKLGHFRRDVVAIQKEFLGAQIWTKLGSEHLRVVRLGAQI